jgi:hypothetical protein
MVSSPFGRKNNLSTKRWVREFCRPEKNEETQCFVSVGAKSYKYAFIQTNLTQFTRSFHGFVEPLRKGLNHLFHCFEQGG